MHQNIEEDIDLSQPELERGWHTNGTHSDTCSPGTALSRRLQASFLRRLQDGFSLGGDFGGIGSQGAAYSSQLPRFEGLSASPSQGNAFPGETPTESGHCAAFQPRTTQKRSRPCCPPKLLSHCLSESLSWR